MTHLSRACLLALSVFALSSCEPTSLTETPRESADPTPPAPGVSDAELGGPIGLSLAAEAVSWSYSYPLKVSGGQLVDQTGRPFLLIGDAAWSAISQLNKAEVDQYLASRRALGFDAILVNLIEHKFANNAPKNIFGTPPFTGKNFTTPNEPYFAHADYVIQAAADQGILVLLAPLYLGYDCGDAGWCAEVKAATNADMSSWGRWVGNRYRGYDNIMWVIGGDTDPSPVIGKVQSMVDGILAADTRHPFTAHNNPGQEAIDPWPGAAWLNVNNVYPRSTTDYKMALAADAGSTKPFFNIESRYDGEGAGAQQLRYQTYGSALSGALGHVYGNCPVWHFNATTASKFCGTTTTWESRLNTQGALNMRYARLFFESRNWSKLIPDTGHRALTSGLGTYGQTNYVTAAYGSDGSSIIAYLPSSRTVTVDGGVLSSATMKVWWFDPSSGAATLVGSFPTSSPRAFTPPGAGDWVLVADDAARDFPAPGDLTGGGTANQPPTAAFTSSCTDLTCQYTDASSDADGSIVSRTWAFGDGSNGGAVNPNHTYPAAGTYTVKLTVKDDAGDTASVTQDVTLSSGSGGGPAAPLARFSYSCTDLSCQFTDGSTDSDGQVVTRVWNFGDGKNGGAVNPYHTYPSAGTYTVRLTVTDDDGNSAATSTDVTVSGGPVTPPTAKFDETCTELSCRFIDASTDDGAIQSHAWAFGDGRTASVANPDHTYAAEGTYSVKLTVTDDEGASASSTKSVAVSKANSSPVADFNETCSELTCSFADASSDPDGTIAGRTWTFGDGTQSGVQSPSHTYASAGTYTVQLTVTDNDGASTSVSKTVTVTAASTAPPVAGFTASCTDLACQFTDASTDSDGEVVGRVWNFGDGKNGGAVNPYHTYPSAGTYTVKLTVTDNDGASSSFTKDVTLTGGAVTPPTAAFTGTCTDLSCKFTDDSSDPDGSIVSRSWSFGDGASSTAIDPSHQYAAAGTYTVKLTVTDNDGATASATKSVTVTAEAKAPTAYFTASCSDLTCAFTDGSTGGTIVSRVWNFGDGKNGGAVNPHHDYPAAGTYTVKLTITDDTGATGTFSRSVTVSGTSVQPPVAGFTASCKDLACQFTDASTDADGEVVSRVWNFGDGKNGGAVNPYHTYPSAGTYTVKLTVTDNDGATSSFTEDVTLTGGPVTPPTAAFTGTCTDLDCTFTDDSSDPDGSIVSRSWSFGDGATSTAINPSHTYAADGTYTVELTVTDDDGATASTSESVTVAAPSEGLTAYFTASCSNLTCALTDGSTGGTIVSRVWNFGDGKNGGAVNPYHTYPAAGTYTVKLTVTDDTGATSAFSGSVTVSEAVTQPPVADFSQSCADLACQFTDASTDADGEVVSRVWSFGDGSNGGAVNPYHTYAAAGTYTVKLTVTDDKGVSATLTKDVTLGAAAAAAPTVSFTHSCDGQTCQFENTSTYSAAQLWWDMGDGDSASLEDPTHTFPGPGTYDVTLWIALAGSAEPVSHTESITIS